MSASDEKAIDVSIETMERVDPIRDQHFQTNRSLGRQHTAYTGAIYCHRDALNVDLKATIIG